MIFVVLNQCLRDGPRFLLGVLVSQKRPINLSIRSKLVLLVGALLAAIAIFLLQFFPQRMEGISRSWA